MLRYWLDKGNVQNTGTLAQECSHYRMLHADFDPTRVIYETIRQKQR